MAFRAMSPTYTAHYYTVWGLAVGSHSVQHSFNPALDGTNGETSGSVLRSRLDAGALKKLEYAPDHVIYKKKSGSMLVLNRDQSSRFLYYCAVFTKLSVSYILYSRCIYCLICHLFCFALPLGEQATSATTTMDPVTP